MDYLNEDLMKKMEQPFLKQNFHNVDKSFEIKPGDIPILVSAPHSVPQLREGKIKQGEYRTGVLAQLLHEEVNCYSAYKIRNDNDDANYDEVNPYKEELINLIKQKNIKYLFDLHIMSAERGHSIDIGTGRGENIQQQFGLVREFVEIFHKNGIDDVEIDHVFSASYPHTVSSTISRECQIVSLQFEFNWRLLDTADGIDNVKNIMNSLIAIMNVLKGE